MGVERCPTADAVGITGIPARTLQEKAAAGLIPGARKEGGSWSFDVDALHALMAKFEQDVIDRAEAKAMSGDMPSKSWMQRMPIPLGRPDQVYFIRAATGHIKIGIAFQPRLRMLELQVGHPLPLMLLAVMPGGKEHEAYLHRFFGRERVRGEWFEASERLLAFISTLGGSYGR